MIQFVIFDIDGTLLDSVSLHGRAWQDALAHYGYSVDHEAARREIGKGSDQLLPRYVPREELDRIEEELTEFRAKLFKERYLDRVKPFSDVPELFQRILDDGKKIALASSGNKDEVVKYKKIAGIKGLTHEETSADDAERSKPHPDIFHAALKRLGNPDPSTVLVIGDTPHDIEAARKAGLSTLGVTCGGWTEPELLDAGAVAVYRSPSDLLAKYDDSPLAR